jgi:FAD/FMN-containing dehydrogenase
MWPDYWALITGRVASTRNPFAGDGRSYGGYVLVEALGTDASLDAPRFEAWLERLLHEGTMRNAVVAQSVADQKALWHLRDAVGELHGLWPQHMAFDIGLPVGAMDDYALRCKAELAQRAPGCESIFYGHIGDGNVHIVVYRAGAEQPKDEIEDVVYGLVREYGGTVAAEHGIGTLKRRWLAHARSPEQIALMRTLKAALDPKNLLNPGKVI